MRINRVWPVPPAALASQPPPIFALFQCLRSAIVTRNPHHRSFGGKQYAQQMARPYRFISGFERPRPECRPAKPILPPCFARLERWPNGTEGVEQAGDVLQRGTLHRLCHRPLTYKEFRRSDGSLGGLRNGGVGTGVRYYNGEQDDPYRDSGRNLAHREALRRCQQDDVVEGGCQVIAEAGNSCVAVAEGTGWRNSGGQRYKLYDRYYVVQLSPEERGNPQQSADEAQIKQWIASLANRAHQLCMADRSHPQHECQPVKDVWSGCGIDAVSSRYR